MSKKAITTVAFSLLTVLAFAQTIVSTTPEDKKVILEEFTGINCVFCPDGHAIAQAIQDNNPGNVFLVNIHTGSFANPGSGQPDFRTSFGAAIAGQSNLTGYPAGTVNRHFFPGQSQGGGTAMSRSQWANASNQILAQPAYLNLGVEAEIDVQTNELTVHVEVYYTGNSPFSTNKLNVALLQNNTLGPQTGGGMGNEYVHMHRLVHMVTGQWGIDINSTTTGSFIDETFTYTIPADYRDVPVELADLELVAFVTETTQEIISGNGAFPTYTGITIANDAFLKDISDIIDQCGSEIAPEITIQNLGSNTLTSLDIEYSVNGGTVESYTWTGNLTSLQSEKVELPAIPYTVQSTNTVSISLPSDDNNANNDGTVDFDEAVGGTGTVYLTLNTDNWGSEVRWNLYDEAGNSLYSGGPYPNNTQINETFELAEGCYTFDLRDTYGDGGGVTFLEDSNGVQLFFTNGNYGSGVTSNFSSDGVLGIGDQNLSSFALYPNPANTELHLVGIGTADITVYNILGSQIMVVNDATDKVSLDVSSLQAGTYFVKLTSNEGTITKKFIVNR
ncbi:MAG: Omp28-related outer membrane protein [Bacteroidia bacterium]|nr:Omp28-related outer membrane protein [Bacteroidia bacterium]NNF29927.1 Omp28-related outer membrane protein [Flavobacteriaceae bacterium]MBT8275838.1 Omp28-related outer membrane protein [Bacteroidia bacterium]NNJ81150.1 Omp28-related outer membrane protein [Flavobacteriaceae bacterium]NNK53381.1 Omp28-related outer membrane protein [Flavobacteriaceae bacterium]